VGRLWGEAKWMLMTNLARLEIQALYPIPILSCRGQRVREIVNIPLVNMKHHVYGLRIQRTNLLHGFNK
jgi:hypothetical protein